jgi:hypothetical protein
MIIYTAVDTWDEVQIVYISMDLNKLKQFMINKVMERNMSLFNPEEIEVPTLDTIEDFDIIFSEAKSIDSEN